MPIQIKRAYEPPAPSDGRRYLVDRVWPRGVGKTDIQIAAWLRAITPSPGLRKWFGHDPAKWDEFRRRYREELQGKEELLRQLADEARRHTITLVYGAKDEQHNNAVALREMIEEMGGKQ